MNKNASLENKNVLITGGAGFIGSELTKQALSNGANVSVVDNLVNGKKSNLNLDDKNLTFYEEDIRNHQVMQNLISKSDYVLGKWSSYEMSSINSLTISSIEIIFSFIQIGIQETMNLYNKKNFIK